MSGELRLLGSTESVDVLAVSVTPLRRWMMVGDGVAASPMAESGSRVANVSGASGDAGDPTLADRARKDSCGDMDDARGGNCSDLERSSRLVVHMAPSSDAGDARRPIFGEPDACNEAASRSRRACWSSLASWICEDDRARRAMIGDGDGERVRERRMAMAEWDRGMGDPLSSASLPSRESGDDA